MDQNLSQRYEVLGLKVHWISENGRGVAVIEVPRQPSHTIVTVKNPRTGSQDVYVGRGTQSDPIADQVLFSWIQSRK